MFTRAMRCLLFVQKPLIFKPVAEKCKPLFVYPISSHYSNSDLLLIKKRYCSTAPKSPESKNHEIPSEKSIHENIADEELQAMLDLDPAMHKRYKILQLEVDIMRQAGKLVPNEIKPFHWIQLLKEDTRTARKKLLTYLFKIEKKQENIKKKKEVARIEREKHKESIVENDNKYKLHKTSMFVRIYDTAINHYYNSRLMQAMMFGQKIVVDCGYDNHMTLRESAECAKQLSFLFSENRVHRDPFDIHFCNVNKSSFLMQKFNNIIPTAYDSDFPLNINECSYTEIFDKSKLVYLTPHCKNDMEMYDPDSIYIIGALVDKTNSEPVSLAKAKKEGIRMAKLPVDKYLLWGSGANKRFPLNQMISILLDLKMTKDWHKALQHIPRRKLENHDPKKPQSFSVTQKILRRKIPQSNEPELEMKSSFSFEKRQKRRF